MRSVRRVSGLNGKELTSMSEAATRPRPAVIPGSMKGIDWLHRGLTSVALFHSDVRSRRHSIVVFRDPCEESLPDRVVCRHSSAKVDGGIGVIVCARDGRRRRGRGSLSSRGERDRYWAVWTARELGSPYNCREDDKVRTYGLQPSRWQRAKASRRSMFKK